MRTSNRSAIRSTVMFDDRNPRIIRMTLTRLIQGGTQTLHVMGQL
ncbi:hypothetical protein [Bifidobacterium sp. SO1]|nr:hypothetical protein [Bifidobacterium sp. SO1]